MDKIDPRKKKIAAVDIVAEGKVIYKEIKAFKKEKGNSLVKEDLESLHKKIVKDHNDFAQIYAIVVTHTIYTGIFFDKALEKYITHLSNHPWKDNDEFIDIQADYLVFVERERVPHCGSSHLARLREDTRKRMHEDNKEFMKMAKETKEIVDKEYEEILQNRRQRIYESLKATN